VFLSAPRDLKCPNLIKGFRRLSYTPEHARKRQDPALFVSLGINICLYVYIRSL
jgi:hypothetical protein